MARAEHLERVRELGAAEALDYRTADPRDLGTFDVIFDPVAKNMREYRRLLASGGRAVGRSDGRPESGRSRTSGVHAGLADPWGRRVRFIQSPPNPGLLNALAKMVTTKT
ncbi:hypothetical protein ACFPJ1_09700 [Kribbella qitaiheensis]|uniref:hypothetical protein n=1 Tax=Kribbella qitaiheensis TaxID=1544730 RepID=UPI0036211277